LLWGSIWQRLWLLKGAKRQRETFRRNRRKWWKRCWPRLKRLHRRKTFRFQSHLLRRRFNPNLLKKEHRHRDNRTRQNLRRSRRLAPCRCRERKPSPCTHRGLSTLTRLGHGTSRGVE